MRLVNKCAETNCIFEAEYELLDVLDMSTDDTAGDLTLHIFSCSRCLPSLVLRALSLSADSGQQEVAIKKARILWN